MSKHVVRLGALVLIASALQAGLTTAGTAAPDREVVATVTHGDDSFETLGLEDSFYVDPALSREIDSDELTRRETEIERAIAALGISEFGPWPTDYAGLVVNAHTLTLRTWWTQEPSTELVERLRSAAPEVRLEVNSDAPWDKNTTTAAAKRLLPTAKERFGIDSITVKQDGSGLVAYHSPGTKPDESGLLRDAGVSVTLVEAEASEPLVGSRQIDQAPHMGGATMVRRTSSTSITSCSTAFSVLRPNGTGYLLSAAHCGPASVAWANNRWTNNAWDGDFFIPNNASQNYTPLDAKIMDPVGGTVGRIYGGHWSSSTQKNVQGSEANFTGQTVALSGANTGERAVKIWHDNFQTNCAAAGAPSVACEVPLIAVMDVEAADNNTPGHDAPYIAKEGDSGGPVHQPNSNGTVAARGIVIKGRNFATACALSSRFDSACATVMLYVPIRPVLSHYNVTIENN